MALSSDGLRQRQAEARRYVTAMAKAKAKGG
jgi:hypothetical protein